MTASGTHSPYDDLDLTLAEAGGGRPVLLLHGGGGPATVAGLAHHLARTGHVLAPVHPGWNGTPRPARISGVTDLADAYLRLLADRRLRDVLVVGSSLGGWIAAEMALRDTAGALTGLVLIDGVGVHVEGEPVLGVDGLDPREFAARAWHDPSRALFDPTTTSAEQRAAQQANMATLRAVAPVMHDPRLLPRLREVRVPALVVWGESDRVATPAYGRAYAAGFADAEFAAVPEAGHLPQVEQPDAVHALIDAYARRTATAARAGRAGTA
ncbi:alpha/beta hydrolase [Streptomyces tremellae]|uniref:Alpha/beta hydrolase n=1 Tax=Streptomyces tremellae TaxID=1124239 RepID=A0ABP7E2L1_9ACTN